MQSEQLFSNAIGFLALIIATGSALFTYGQLRLVKSQLQIDSYSRIAVVTRDLIGLAFSHTELLDIFEDRHLTDKRKEIRYLQLWINHIEVIWNIHKQGSLSGEHWQASVKDIEDFFSLSVVCEYWETVREYYPASFVQFIWRIHPRTQKNPDLT